VKTEIGKRYNVFRLPFFLFPHFVRRKEYGNRFINLTSHFVLKAVIGKTEYGFVFRFP